MTIDSLNDYSTTPGLNTDIAGTNINIGCPPQDVGVFMRTIMAQLAYAVQGTGGSIPATWHVGALTVGGQSVTAVLPGYLFGLTTANNSGAPTTTIDVASGIATDSTGAAYITLAAGLSKLTTGAWVAGSGMGGMGNGLTITANTSYHVFLIVNGGATDVYFDTSATAVNAPVGTTSFRRIWSFKTLVGSTSVQPYKQNGNRCDIVTPVDQFTGAPGSLLASTLALKSIPTGVTLEAILRGNVFDPSANNSILYISSLQQADVAPTSPIAITGQTGGSPASAGAWSENVMTDNVAQIRTRVSTTTLIISIGAYGWIDTRGRLA